VCIAAEGDAEKKKKKEGDHVGLTASIHFFPSQVSKRKDEETVRKGQGEKEEELPRENMLPYLSSSLRFFHHS